MVISHKHKFIFIHIPKCAGNTICYSLLNNLYFDTKNDIFNLNAYKDRKNKVLNYTYLNTNTAQVFKNVKNQGNSTGLKQHDKLKKLKDYLNKKNLNINDYFKFSFMRNPWARRVSQHQFAKKLAKINKGGKWAAKISKMSFYEFITKRNDSQLNWVSDEKDNIAVDFLGSSKNLQNEFNFVCEKIGISRIHLPHRNVTKHKHYTEYYDDETRQIVAEKCAKDIEYFNYKFGE